MEEWDKIKTLIRFISKWAWKKELYDLEKLLDERDEMLDGLERCGWPCRLVELPEYYLNLVQHIQQKWWTNLDNSIQEYLNRDGELEMEVTNYKDAVRFLGKEKVDAAINESDMSFKIPVGYEALGLVLSKAMDQAAHGKGKERHANGEPFEQQKICRISRAVGVGFAVGQAMKKAEEALRLEKSAGLRELLGAINYLAAAYIVINDDV